MFWIVGGEELVHSLYKAWPTGPLGPFHEQLNHKAWAGVAFYDLIFPLFVFIIGVSIVFSVRRMLEQDGLARTVRRVVVRSLVLYLFGLLVYGGISKGVDHIRWLGVLQRLAICYLCASLLFCAFRLKGLIVVCASLLLVYWGLTSLRPDPRFQPRNRPSQSPATRTRPAPKPARGSSPPPTTFTADSTMASTCPSKLTSSVCPAENGMAPTIPKAFSAPSPPSPTASSASSPDSC